MQIEILKLKDEIRKIGDELMKLYHSDFEIQNKQDASPLTEADLLSNQLLVEILGKTGIPILSEETTDNLDRLNSEKLWIIDPLDGTKDFIQKTGEFSIMVALIDKEKPILGIVYLPVSDKLYFAEKGKGAYLEESKIKNEKLKITKRKLNISNKNNFKNWTILVSRNHLGKEEVALAKKLKFKAQKPTGSIGVKLGLIAEGKAEIYLHAIDKTWEWDIAAAQIILEEAGGKVTDIAGMPLKYNKKIPKNFTGILATNGLKHTEIIAELKNNF